MRIDVESPIHQGQTLFHADEANAVALLYGFAIKAGPGIPYTQANLIRRSPQAHYKALCTAVLCRIVKSFLQYSEKAERNVRWQRGRNIMAFKVDLHVLFLAEFPAEALHGSVNSQIFQPGRVQFMRQRLGIGSYLAYLIYQLFQAVPDFCGQIVSVTLELVQFHVNNARR